MKQHEGIISHCVKTAEIIVFDPTMCKIPCALTRQAASMNQPTLNTCNSSWPHITRFTTDQFSSSSCKGTSAHLHIIESNTMISSIFSANYGKFRNLGVSVVG